MASIARFFSDISEKVSASSVGEFHRQVSEFREKLYEHNFFLAEDQRSNKDETLLAPTSLEQQYAFFTPYEHGNQFTHDLYAIVYKPLVMGMYGFGTLLASSAHGVDALSATYTNILGLILSEEELPRKENDSAMELWGDALYQFMGGAYLLGVWLTVDTASSALSLLCRTLTTFIVATKGYLDHLQEQYQEAHPPAVDPAPAPVL